MPTRRARSSPAVPTPTRPAPAQPEAALYPAVKRFLLSRGWEPKGEVCGCDVAAVQGGEVPRLLVAEMKLSASMDLLLQAADRLRVADEVWLAVLATQRGRDRDPRLHRLCRLLGLGLLAVRGGQAEVLAEPGPYRPRPSVRRRKAVLSEHARRVGDPAPGGTRGIPVETAYRQAALRCARRMMAEGPLRPCDLRVEAPEAGRMLLRNVYGWFARVERGRYGLTEAGRNAAAAWVPDGAAVPG